MYLHQLQHKGKHQCVVNVENHEKDTKEEVVIKYLYKYIIYNQKKYLKTQAWVCVSI